MSVYHVIRISQIKGEVAREFELTVDDLEGQSRKHTQSVPRHIAFHYCRSHTKASLPKIGREFGYR